MASEINAVGRSTKATGWKQSVTLGTGSVRWDYILLGAILVVALALRLAWLDDQGFWYDEAFRLLMARHLDSPDVAIMSLHDDPFLVGFNNLFLTETTSEFANRLLPALAGAALVPALFLLGRLLFDRTIGLTAAFLGAINPFNIYFSRETRAYTLGVLLTVLTIWALVTLLRHGRRRDWSVMIVLTTCAIYAHSYLLGILIVQNLMIGVLFLFRRKISRAGLRVTSLPLWVAAQGLILLLCSPKFYALITFSSNSQNVSRWVPVTQWSLLPETLATMIMGYGVQDMIWPVGVLHRIGVPSPYWVVLTLMAVALLAALWHYRKNLWCWYLVSVAFGSIIGMAIGAICITIPIFHVNIFLTRYSVLFAGPLILFLAAGLVVLARFKKTVAVVVGGGLIILTVGSVVRGISDPELTSVAEAHKKYDYKQIVSYIEKQNRALGLSTENSLVTHYSKCSLAPFVLYCEDRIVNKGVTFPGVPECAETNLDNDAYAILNKPLGTLSVPFPDAVKGRRYVWVLFSWWEKNKFHDHVKYNIKHFKISNHYPEHAVILHLVEQGNARLLPLEGANFTGIRKEFFGFMALYLLDLEGATDLDRIFTVKKQQ